jgi:elongation factor G
VLPHPDWPTLPYFETIQAASEQEAKVVSHGRGRSEYAHVAIRVEPLPRGAGMRFENRAGAAIPDSYISSIQAAISESTRKGPILGEEVTDLLVAVTNGNYHQDDSTQNAFNAAGRQAFQKALRLSAPVLLEPIMRIQLTLDEEFVGELSNEIVRCRGETTGMDSNAGLCELDFWLPLAESARLTRFASGLSFGKAKISMQFLRYEKAPSPEPPDAMTVADHT